jgi:protein-export membrane protein SecD
MLKQRIFAVLILIIGAVLALGLIWAEQSGKGWFAKRPFHYGLDLSGGSHLLYRADVSQLPSGEVDDSMEALRDIIERRINIFGVGEPVVQVETSTLSGFREHRLSIELPGVTDLGEAIKMIGQTPFLEFKTMKDSVATVNADGQLEVGEPEFETTALTGKYLKSAQLQFNPNTGEPIVALQFNDEGAKLFEEITRNNVGKVVAIYLDGQVISAPVVQQAITGGQAIITGNNTTPQEAKNLVARLNSGALPVPITLISTQTIGATLGVDAINAGVKAAVIGFVIVALFLIIWYRLPGLIAVVALAIYVLITLALYRLIPVTLTAAGIAGFIISIGMAVDANVLIFERFREERARGRVTSDALKAGFDRAWLSIRDANTASLIIAVILYWFGTSLIKGFALTFGLGVFVSLLSAILITRIFLRALPSMEHGRFGRFLFSSGADK